MGAFRAGSSPVKTLILQEKRFKSLKKSVIVLNFGRNHLRYKLIHDLQDRDWPKPPRVIGPAQDTALASEQNPKRSSELLDATLRALILLTNG